MAKEQSLRVIGKAALVDLARLDEQCRGKISNASGQIGAAIRAAAEAKNLHPGAARMVFRIRRMEPIAMRNFLDNFDLYREHLELDAKKATDMFIRDAERAEEAEDPDKKLNGHGKKAKPGKKAKAPAAISEAADRAEETSERKPH